MLLKNFAQVIVYCKMSNIEEFYDGCYLRREGF